MTTSGGQAKSSRKKIFYGYWIVLSLAVLNFIPVTLFMSCNPTFMPYVAEGLNVSSGTVLYILSVFSLANTALFPVFGRLFAKYDSRILCTFGVCSIAFSFVCQSLVTEAWQFILCGIPLAGGCVPLLFMAPANLINRWFNKRAGMFIGIVLACTGVGGVIWNMVSGALLLDFGFRITYRIFAVLVLVSGLPFTIFVLRDRPSDKGLLPYGSEDTASAAQPSEQASEQAQDTQTAQSTQTTPQELEQGQYASKVYRTKTFKLMLVYALFLNLGMYVCAMTPSYVGTLSFAATMPMLGATCAACVMGAQTVAKVLWGTVADKKPLVSVVGGILMGITGVLCLAFFNSAPWQLYIGTIIFGFFYALSTVTMPILTRHFFGMQDYSLIFSKISMACTMGTFGGSFIWGTVINVTGGYTPVLFGVCCMLSIALVCVLLVNKSSKALSLKNNSEANDQK